MDLYYNVVRNNKYISDTLSMNITFTASENLTGVQKMSEKMHKYQQKAELESQDLKCLCP